MSLFQDLIQGTIDLGTKKSGELKTLKLDDTIKDWNLLLTSNREVQISSLVKNGPLLLIFIRGTWCPFCRMHMTRLRAWVKKLQGKNATIIVVSSEPVDAIKSWLEKNPFPYLFASDENYELSDYFGVRVIPDDFSQAATFIIDSDLSVRMAYTGKRTQKNFDEMEDELL
jgi:peroxiredoxin